ncbi:MAG: hypothetical protein ACFB3T_01385 [Geminicoccaceae bacterium]
MASGQARARANRADAWLSPALLSLLGRLLCAAGIIALIATVKADAATPPWLNDPMARLEAGRSVRAVLGDIARQLETPLRLSAAVEGTLAFDLEPDSAGNQLSDLAMRHDLVWYFDGVILAIAHSDEVDSRILELGTLEPGRLERALLHLDVLDPRFPLRAGDEGELALISGPPYYLALVERVLDGLRQPVRADDSASPAQSVRVIRGRPPGDDNS